MNVSAIAAGSSLASGPSASISFTADRAGGKYDSAGGAQTLSTPASAGLSSSGHVPSVSASSVAQANSGFAGGSSTAASYSGSGSLNGAGAGASSTGSVVDITV